MIDSTKFVGFYETLKEANSSYEGEYKDLISYCPDFFNLLCDILTDKRTPWQIKLMIDAALAYFVLPDDVIPDHEEKGYIDDLFIVTHVLKEIKDGFSNELIEIHWKEDTDISKLIEEVYYKTNMLIEDKKFEILRKVGLHKYQSLDLNEYSGTNSEKVIRLTNEKRELLGLLAFVVKKIYRLNSGRNPSLDKITNVLKYSEDYSEIERLIELSKENSNYISINKIKKQKDSILEQKLKSIKLKALLKRNKID